MKRARARARSTPQRYQLDRKGVGLVAGGHPWIFRGHLSSAAAALADGQWLALYDGQNRIVAHGVYAAEGAIAIRILSRSPKRPRAALFRSRIDAALARRAALRAETDGFRAIHGESDGLPGVTVDVYGVDGTSPGGVDSAFPGDVDGTSLGGVVVAQAYATGLDALARFAARHVAGRLGAPNIVLRAGHRRFAAAVPSAEEPESVAPSERPGRESRGGPGARVVRGEAIEEVPFREGTMTLIARPMAGQKGGTFLDLRGLRRWVAGQALGGARVLNLFAYSGAIGLAAEQAGAAHIVQVDRAADALALAARHHVRDARKHELVTADVFDWLPRASDQHQLVIVDPPSMTSRIEQVPGVLATYRRLHKAAAARVAPGGTLVLCCCTSRVTRARFRETVGSLGWTVIEDLRPEADHPVGFPEADYLKVTILRAPA